MIAALTVDYRAEHVFVLSQELALYEVYQGQIARIFYQLWASKESYRDPGVDYYEQHYQQHVPSNLKKKASALGFDLVAHPTTELIS